MTFGILFLHTKGRQRYFWLITLLSTFMDMLISGTRRAIVVPFAGMGLYCILSKKFKIVIGGFIFIFAISYFLKFTTIGNSVYEIRRFRTGLEPNNPLLKVRFDNQQKLKQYLADKPL